ncbi:SOS response-associated peptidase family protein [Tunturibacter empetritectus]|uniref:SOS response-associated peptidase YedK n=1 Tax=Tunturiibacter empetritectus TaxID=3069691 RepID=A0A7W8MTI2_9BACT|nr:putative SOS response-associated peptidase YedK [Edaphobacter lichenicola]
MCGRYYRTFDKQKIAEALRAQATGDPLAYAPGYNIAPTTTQPVLRQERETFGRELVPMRWGLVGFGTGRGPGEQLPLATPASSATLHYSHEWLLRVAQVR